MTEDSCVFVGGPMDGVRFPVESAATDWEMIRMVDGRRHRYIRASPFAGVHLFVEEGMTNEAVVSALVDWYGQKDRILRASRQPEIGLLPSE